MTKPNTKKQEKYNKTVSIRVSSSTKVLIDKKLAMLNKSEEFGKVTYDGLILLLIQEMNKDQFKKLQISTITWSMEEERLKHLWSKKYSKKDRVSEEKWKQMLYRGSLQDFICEHSRIPM